MMEHGKNDFRLGRFLSLVLRHNPSAAGITLDAKGWADVQQLLDGVNNTGRRIDMETLARIVRENNKNRYSFSEDGRKIRANQGHSVTVDVELEEKTPPAVLYHGTASRSLDSIMQSGLAPQNRQHVHLSADVETAVHVGKRHGKPIVLVVDAAAMAKDGHIFWISENHVWLCKAVPRAYLSVQAYC